MRKMKIVLESSLVGGIYSATVHHYKMSISINFPRKSSLGQTGGKTDSWCKDSIMRAEALIMEHHTTSIVSDDYRILIIVFYSKFFVLIIS